MITTLLPILCIVCHVSGMFLNELPHLRSREVTEAEQCERISQAMDALWKALPNVDLGDIFISEGKLKDVLDTEFASYAKHVGFVTPSYTIATHEGRKEVACKLAGVHSISDYLALFRGGDTSIEPYRKKWAWWQNHGLETLHDADKFVDILYYFIRITGFPQFPLDIYDADMANYMIDRLLEHNDTMTLIWPAYGPPTPPKEEWVKALTNETPDQLFRFLHIFEGSRERETRQVAGLVKIYSAGPELIHLAEVIIEGGFFARIEK